MTASRDSLIPAEDHSPDTTGLLTKQGMQRTDLYCHRCAELGGKDKGYNPNFTASLDYSIDGNHKIECPRCGHFHYRKIQNGRVTAERFDSDSRTTVVERRNVWKSDSQPIMTSTASAFLRERWLNRES